MTTNSPAGRPSSGNSAPPASRRSARQQRLANREANRNLNRAATRGSSGSNGSLLLYTIAAIVIAAIVVVGALLLTNQSTAKQTLGSPNAPVGSAITPVTITTNGLTLGNADAKHTIDLWEDFQCPGCRDFTVETEPQVVANYVQTGKAKLVWHDFLVIDSSTGGTESLDSANAARCAADQGMFWTYHDWLYANQYAEGSGAFTKGRLKTIGQQAGIKDSTKFNTCVDSGTHNADVQAEQSQIPAGSTGTPTMIIDGGAPFTPGNYATVSAALDQALGVTPSPSVGASAAPSAPAGPAATAVPSATVVPSVSVRATPS
jgi:protein-disulfide isomerase